MKYLNYLFFVLLITTIGACDKTIPPTMFAPLNPHCTVTEEGILSYCDNTYGSPYSVLLPHVRAAQDIYLDTLRFQQAVFTVPQDFLNLRSFSYFEQVQTLKITTTANIERREILYRLKIRYRERIELPVYLIFTKASIPTIAGLYFMPYPEIIPYDVVSAEVTRDTSDNELYNILLTLLLDYGEQYLELPVVVPLISEQPIATGTAII